MTLTLDLHEFVGEGRVCTALAYAVIDGCQPDQMGSVGCELDDLFDLASLTKPFATVSTIAHLLADGVVELDQRLDFWLPEAPLLLGQQNIADLLHHRAGLLAFSEHLAQGLQGSGERRLRELRHRVLEVPLKHKPGTIVYSDLGFILLAWVCQRAGRPVDDLASELGFVVPDGSHVKRCIPTGFDPDGRPLVGRVHDPTCRLAGGRNCGHAGWFGSLRATTNAVRQWLDLSQGRPSLLPDAARLLIVAEAGARTAGFDVPTAGGTTGGGWGKGTFGHLGYTGTAFWVDPETDRAAVLLTNRTWPDGVDRGIGDLRRHFFGAVARRQ